ncbi:MAG: hypothetical protein CVU91_06075 [Firmicutes bacterium HGW-Firmicutes-16]|nr:MAG: hypothetical protein CVU91_06075 [Firmicutes bacterium HGW-Firmicutes-16]
MVIFEDYGVEIILKDGRYYIRYDAGRIAIIYDEIEITKEEAERAQQGPQNAMEIIWYYKNKKRGLV